MLQDKSQTEKPAPVTVNKTYHLSLSDGTKWCLSADQRSMHMLDSLAHIMRLKQEPSNGSPGLVFCTKGASRRDDLDDTGTFRPFRLWRHDNCPDLFCEAIDNSDPGFQYLHMKYGLIPVYRDSVGRGGVPAHGALVELNGHGAMMIGPSGAGKSTCCHRLPEHWGSLCDDEALIVMDKDNRQRVHPFPTWSDYMWNRSRRTWDVQCSVPLKGIFFLERARIDKIKPLGGAEASVLMNAAANQVLDRFYRIFDKAEQRSIRQGLFENACRIVKEVPHHRLCVSRDGRFWEQMEDVLDRE